ncbi:MAG TPA: serine/threonine-protein kinase [Baekduia sp.]|uniref:serine/threonine-protein kinase n=1 Tax=Baekduia sp. TaxID=2600305 RepID=UPI002C914963|nr:serine/threonine-protein kinase [Baekduia sp.]HMJ37200.1 serine/threonine-protein kinase [Baekduia sp.]
MPAVHQVSLPPRYRVVHHIANGGMASVWAAQDAVLERLVAVKTLAAGYAADPAARRRFTREARAAARVSDHPNVVTVFDIGDHQDQAFIVMEHFAGGTVADRLRRGEPVPVATALRWLRQTASALDTAHAADIVHRDVKPGNLLLDAHGRLAVGDFGIASLAGETQVTAAGQVLGTAAYLSPEQARGNPATPASDRYSLAVVAYELLCGRKLFDGDTPLAQARAHAESDPPAPTGPSAAAGAVLQHGLAKDPAARPPTATAFVDELDRVLGERGGDPTMATAVVPSRRRAAAQWSAAGTPRFSRERERTPVPAPARTPAPPAANGRGAPPTTPPPEPIARAHSPHRRAWALAALTALCLAGGAAAALISDDGNGGDAGSGASADRAARPAASPSSKSSARSAKKPAPAAGPASSTPTTSAPAATTPAPATDGRSAAQINNAGYAMLPGDPQGAVPLLSQAVEKFRAAGDTSSTDYAYSLYNYGWALRLAGRPAEAIPYLEERLRISSYKRGIVEDELKTAQAQAGGATADTSSPAGKGAGKAKKHQ